MKNGTRGHWLEKTAEELTALLAEWKQPRFRAKQIYGWLHDKRVADSDAMTNIPAHLRELLHTAASLRQLRELERRDADDALTSKWLFEADRTLVETVLIVERRHSRRTVCVSSMAGCPLGCVFCATGRHGYTRDLSAGEIIEQVYRVDNFCRAENPGEGVSHVVFMGMGEPLLNLDAVLAAAATFAMPEGMNLSGRHITLSTVGVPDGIRRLAELGVNYRLALALLAPNQKIREKLLPAAKRWQFDELFPALEEFAAVASRDMTFEYCLIDGVNASEKDARELAKKASRFRAKINLIPLNPVPGFDAKPPGANAVRAFRDILEERGVSATIRVEKGQEIGAACGQLRAERLGGASA